MFAWKVSFLTIDNWFMHLFMNRASWLMVHKIWGSSQHYSLSWRLLLFASQNMQRRIGSSHDRQIYDWQMGGIFRDPRPNLAEGRGIQSLLPNWLSANSNRLVERRPKTPKTKLLDKEKSLQMWLISETKDAYRSNINCSFSLEKPSISVCPFKRSPIRWSHRWRTSHLDTLGEIEQSHFFLHLDPGANKELKCPIPLWTTYVMGQLRQWSKR